MKRLTVGFVAVSAMLVLLCAGRSEAQIGAPEGGPGCTGTPVNGSITTGDPTQNGRVFRDGIPDTCTVADACTTIAGTYHYHLHTFHNFSAATACVTLNVTTACTGTNFIYVTAYVGGFNAAAPCTNDVGSIGGSPNPTGTMAFNVPANTNFQIVAAEVTANAGCPSYDFTLTGCPVPVDLQSFSVE